MPLKSRLTVSIPNTSLPTWLFTSPTAPLPTTPLILDPLSPSTRSLSLSTYRLQAQRFAQGLRTHGFNSGDRLLYVSGNSLAFYAVYMGTIMAGGVFSGIHGASTVEQIEYYVRDTGCKVLLAGNKEAYGRGVEALGKVREEPGEGEKGDLAEDVYFVDREVMFGEKARDPPVGKGCKDWGELLASEEEGTKFDWNEFCTDPGQLATLNYTSGSTGPPKGVMASHRNLVANSTQWIRMQEEDPNEKETTKALSWVGWLPMIYVFGQTQYLLTGPKRGVRNYLMEKFDLESMISLVDKYRTTELFGSPTIVIGLVNSPVAQQLDLTCITSVQIGGAPLKRPLGERLEKMLGHPGLVAKQGWGMTEMTCIPLGWDPSDNSASMSVGELLPNCEGKVLSIDGTRELGPNERGEMYIRAPTVTQGYWRKAEQTKAVYGGDGWLRTGDLAYYDADGKWFVVDRLRELIVTGEGAQIVPSEVESVLLEIRGVTDAGVAAVEVEGKSGKEPRAFVVLDPGMGLTVKDVQRVLGEKLDASHQMTAGVFAVEEIPKLTGAKVDRVLLRKVQPISRT